jgi:hypothetical protein
MRLNHEKQKQGNHEGINTRRFGNGLPHQHGSCQQSGFLGIPSDGFTRFGSSHAFADARPDGTQAPWRCLHPEMLPLLSNLRLQLPLYFLLLSYFSKGNYPKPFF